MLLRLVDDELFQAGAGGLAGEVHLVCCLLFRVWRSGAFAGFAELGPRHGFGAVADLFGDIYDEILRRPTSPYRRRV